MHTEKDGALAHWIENSVELQTSDVFVLYGVIVVVVFALAVGVFQRAKARDRMRREAEKTIGGANDGEG